MTITEVKSHQRINSCVSANVSGIKYESDRSHVSLLLEMASEECILDISNGSLYLRGVCLVNSEDGRISSETFVLGAISEYFTEEIVRVTMHRVEKKFRIKIIVFCLMGKKLDRIAIQKFTFFYRIVMKIIFLCSDTIITIIYDPYGREVRIKKGITEKICIGFLVWWLDFLFLSVSEFLLFST